MSSHHVSLPSRTRSCRSMWLCFREPSSQDYCRHHAFFPPFSYWRPVVLHWLGQYPQKNPSSSQGTWVRRLYIQDNCIFPAAPHSQGRDHMEPPLSSGVTVSFLTCWTLSLPESTLSTSWGLENLLSVEGLLTGWENKLSSRNPNLSPGVFVWRTLVLSGDLFFSWPVSPGV